LVPKTAFNPAELLFLTESEGGKPIAAVAIDAQAWKCERMGIRHLLQLPNGREITELALTFLLITRACAN
jgi:hypothetical protein